MSTPKALIKIMDEQGIEKSDAQKLVEAFGGPFEEAGDILSTYKEINVTDGSQTAEMLDARTKRLVLKKARATVEANRKDLKSDIVKQGRAIDSVAKFVKEAILPAEEYLQLQEDFVKIQEKEKKEKRLSGMREKLLTYTDDISIYNLDTMGDQAFDMLVEKLEGDKVRKETEAKEAERKRLAEIEAEKKEQERVRLENEKLRKENEAKEEKLKAERAKAREKQKKADEEAAAKLKVEREKREALEAEQRAKDEAEAKAKADDEEAERKKLLSPDKDKLADLVVSINKFSSDNMPAVKSAEAQKVVTEAASMLTAVTEFIMREAKKL